MKNFFEKFNDLETEEKKELELVMPLEKRIRFEKGNILLDGKKVFTVPIQQYTQDEINVLGIHSLYNKMIPGRIYAGTGQCCFGHVYRIEVIGEETKLRLQAIMPVNTNVYDILPVNKEGSVIVTGIGCAGKGVRLIQFDGPKMIDILAQDEFEKLSSDYGCGPSFSFDLEKKKIYLQTGSGYHHDLVPALEKHNVDIEKALEACTNFTRTKK